MNNNSNSNINHYSNYYDRNHSGGGNNNQQIQTNQQQQPQQPQMATQFTNSISNNVPVTFLSILRDGKIQMDEVSNSWGENGDWLLRSLVMSINQMLSINDQYPNNYSQFLPEHMKLPMITIEGYIARIIKYSPCSKECFVIILMYIDRLIQKRNFVVNSYNIHRILITCVLVAAKYLDDIFYNNQFYSQVGGVGVKEINVMELDFLKLLSFDVSANTDIYSVYLDNFDKYTKRLQITMNYQPNSKHLPLPIPIHLNPNAKIISNSTTTTSTTTTAQANNTNTNKNTSNTNTIINTNKNSTQQPQQSFNNNNNKPNSNKNKNENDEDEISNYHNSAIPFRYPLVA